MPSRRPPSEIHRSPPPALAAADLRRGHLPRPADQDLGHAAHSHGRRHPGHTPFLRITHWTNEGAAFSLFADSASPHTVRWALIGFSLAGGAGRSHSALIRLGNRFTLTTVALALVFAGALGNVHDRIAYGSVVDFIEVHIFTYHWPDFNIADSSVVTGACLLLLDSLLPKKASGAISRSTQ